MRPTHTTRALLVSAVCMVALAAARQGADAAARQGADAAARQGADAAAKAKQLNQSDFFGLAYSCSDCWPASINIAGDKFSGTIINLFNYGSHVSLNARKLPGYNAVAFKVGCSDTSDIGASSVVRVFGDAVPAPLAKFTVTQGQPARLEIVPFSGHGTLNFVKQYPIPKDCEAVIANPAAIVLGPPQAAPLTISTPTVAAGGQETISAMARSATQVTVVVTYASGQQQVVGPTSVPTSGRLSVTFTVAQGASGVARVAVVTANGVVQGTFTVTG